MDPIQPVDFLLEFQQPLEYLQKQQTLRDMSSNGVLAGESVSEL
jgi:hypothetical protein